MPSAIPGWRPWWRWLAGGLLALVHGVVAIYFRANQIISGVAINIFALGITAFLDSKLTNFQGFTPIKRSEQLPYVPSTFFLAKIPFFGQVFFQQNIIVYVGLILLVAINFMLFRTRLGLRIRAVGEHPQAADTAGINVYTIRYGCVIASGRPLRSRRRVPLPSASSTSSIPA